MNCAQVRELLSEMADREISKEDLRRIEDHMASCRECAYQSTMMIGMKNLLQQWRGVKSSVKFTSNVMDKIEKEPPPGLLAGLSRGQLTGIIAAIAGIGLAVVFLVTSVGGDGNNGAGGATGGGSGTGNGSSGQSGNLTSTGRRQMPHVSDTKGAVRVKSPGSSPSLGSPGDAMPPGHTIMISSRGMADLTFPAGFEMRLENGAEFEFGSEDAAGELKSGRASFRATKRPVRTETLAIACRGTKLEFGSEEALLSCEISADDSVTIIVASGTATATVDGSPYEIAAPKTLRISSDRTVDLNDAATEQSDMDRLRQWGTK